MITEPGAVADLRRACAIQARKIQRTGRLNAKGRDVTVFVLTACHTELARRRAHGMLTAGALIVAGVEAAVIVVAVVAWYFRPSLFF